MTTLDFVQGSERRKELARLLAKSLTAEIGLDGLLNSGVTAAELVAVLGDDLAGLVRQAASDAAASAETLGFGAVDDAAFEATVQAAVQRVLTAATGQLAGRLADLAAAVDRMLAASSADSVVTALGSQALQDALLVPIAAALSAAAAGTISGVEADVRSEAVASHNEEQLVQGADEPQLYEWQTLEDDRVCGDGEIFEVSCSARHGKQLTYDEWAIFGMPGDPDGPTICAVYSGPGMSRCRCGLIPADSAASTPNPINIAEAIARGKEQAQSEAA